MENAESQTDWELLPFKWEPISEDAKLIARKRDELANPESAEAVRLEYGQLVERLADCLAMEALFREHVLSDDEPSTNVRLRSVLLLYATAGIANSKVRVPTPGSLEDDPEVGGPTNESRRALRDTLARRAPDLYFAILASYRYWLSDSHSRFLGESADEYRADLELSGVISEVGDNSQAFDVVDAVVNGLNSVNCSLASSKVDQWLNGG
jgi:hypothetical protein